MSLKEIQQAFLAAVYGGDAEPLAALTDAPKGASTREAIEVYQNNTAERLRRVLAQAYPVIAALVGERVFGQLARLYVVGSPSRDGALHSYGADFYETVGQVLQNEADLEDVPYLADMARLEWQIHRASYAPARRVFDFAALSSLEEADYQRIVLELARDLAVVNVRWPVADIWHMHQPGQRMSETEMVYKPRCLLVECVTDQPGVREIGETTQNILQAVGDGRTLVELVDAQEGNELELAACLQAGWIDSFYLE